MKRIAKIDAVSLGYMQGLIGAILGLIIGAFITVMSLFVGGLFNSATGGEGSMMISAGFGVAAIFLVPLFYGIGGFIAGIVFALIYNLAAKVTGGIAVRLEDVTKEVHDASDL